MQTTKTTGETRPMADYYLRLKSGSNKACEIRLIECDNDAEASEVANGVAVAWGRGNGSTEVSYAVETYGGRAVDEAVVGTAVEVVVRWQSKRRLAAAAKTKVQSQLGG